MESKLYKSFSFLVLCKLTEAFLVFISLNDLAYIHVCVKFECQPPTFQSSRKNPNVNYESAFLLNLEYYVDLVITE